MIAGGQERRAGRWPLGWCVAAGLALAAAAAGRPGEVGAPMPGRVIDLVTKVGEHVKSGQKLLVTEAMKLETVIKAPVDGLVREIVAGAGESVEGGDLLVVIEEGSAPA